MNYHKSRSDVPLNADEILRAGPQSFSFTVRDDSMIGAGIRPGDQVIGDWPCDVNPGAVVLALFDGESSIRRVVREGNRLWLVSENPNRRERTAATDVIIQGVMRTVVRRFT